MKLRLYNIRDLRMWLIIIIIRIIIIVIIVAYTYKRLTRC